MTLIERSRGFAAPIAAFALAALIMETFQLDSMFGFFDERNTIENGGYDASTPVVHALRWLAASALLLLGYELGRRSTRSAQAEQEWSTSVQAILDSTADGIITIDEVGTVRSFNRAAEMLFGWSAEDVMGRNVSILIPEPHHDRHDGYLLEYARTGRANILGKLREVSGLRKDGSTIPIELAVTEQKHEERHQFTAVLRNITSRREMQDEIRRLAYYDDLTGLPNRRLFEDRLASIFNTSMRYSRSFAVLIVDLDRFKYMNDNLGHSLADGMLAEVAKRLIESLRFTDFVGRADWWEDQLSGSPTEIARLGGDQFIVILSDLVNPVNAGLVARRVLEVVSKPIVAERQEFFLTASIGISVFPSDERSTDPLLRCASLAMYEAKRAGGNQSRFYSERMNVDGSRRFMLEARLRRALENGDFNLHYQPIFNAKTECLVAAEALLRWSDADVGEISPVEFIPILEETGLIVSVGEWVLETACTTSQGWRAAGHDPIRMSVNLSGYQIRDESFLDMVERCLKDAHLSAHDLELEITESTVIENDELANRTFDQLKEMGVGIALDDFGTGYSSLSLLRSVPTDRVKIDRSFVTNLTTTADDRALAAAIIAMAHSLRLEVVAEGVERNLQKRFLSSQGCDELQGNLIGRPVPRDEFTKHFDPRPQIMARRAAARRRV